jgi:hypothetical protein
MVMATISRPSPDRIEKVVEPYVREVGKLVASWNTLHERLGELFSAVLNTGHPGIGSAIWYSTQSDRAQREMLRAATEAAAAEGRLAQQTRDEIKWLLDRANELANERNDAIHAPVALFTDQDGTKLMTEYIFGNPRASNLRGKDLPEEFRWSEQKATLLAGYALLCAIHLRNPMSEWPKRPDLPTRGKKILKVNR